ncbi:MAG: hypothetical protein KKG47_11875 [Proteobacteria bacterium]|nr:hypothetical protein [Pseudomonadota bacterium]MBU1737819.1 hypothetical protein [Pseudomonadota bacterium]
MGQLDDLARLEEAVQKLVSALQKTGQDKTLIESQLKNKDHEIAELNERIRVLQEERSQVHQRVSGLINSIDLLEKQVVGQTGASSGEGRAEEKTLF